MVKFNHRSKFMPKQPNIIAIYILPYKYPKYPIVPSPYLGIYAILIIDTTNTSKYIPID